jgi:sugar-specific transcriptional regulator TrmB
VNLEIVLKTLVLIGFFQTDAQVYLHLTIEGPQQAKNIAQTLRMPNSRAYRVLYRLRSRGIVVASEQHPHSFAATPFEEVLEKFRKTTLKDAESMESCKKEILSTWNSLIANGQH